MRTVTRLSALILAAGLLVAACGSSKSSSKSTTTTSTTTTTATTTTTTAVLTSNSALAVALDESILSGQQVASTLGLSAAAQPYVGTSAAPAPPQGGLSLDGVAAVFPDPSSYKGLLEGNATVGANRSFLVPAGTSGYVLNILAIKFNSAQAGQTFVQSATQLATTFANAKTNPHPEVKVGLTPGAVLVVPPRAPSTNETVVTAALYSDGVYYLVSTTAPSGAIKDEVVIKALKGQDAKYVSAKAKIDSTSS